MPILTIPSLRGGMNDTDPPIALPDDQVTRAENVEWIDSPIGSRRRGATPIDLGSVFDEATAIVWSHRHYPTTELTEAQLWVMGLVDGAAVLAYKDTSWHTVTMPDAPVINGVSEYQLVGQTLHGKLFLAYHSEIDRLHVWDGETFRRCGLEAPEDAPTAVDAGSGTFTQTRYYRVRMTAQDDAGVTRRRSEPSPVLTVEPSGSGSGILVTCPAGPDEGETHWDVEASLNQADFYRIATVAIATTTYTDETDAGLGYALSGVLSEDLGDYTVIPSARYLIADEDRLIPAGSWASSEAASIVAWTPVWTATGVGNDERIPLDPVSTVNLDGYEGGGITGLARATAGTIRVFKHAHTYSLIRTGIRTRAYEAIVVSKVRGAIIGSIVDGIDQVGNAVVFFLDPDVGPCVIARGGIQRCGRDLWTTWQRVTIDAPVVARAVYYRAAQQVQWFVAVDGEETPSLGLVLHTALMRPDTNGELRGGWAIWTGAIAAVVTTCLFSANIDANTDRSRVLVPFYGRRGTTPDDLLWRGNTGETDGETAYVGHLDLKPYAPGGLVRQVEVKTLHLLATATPGASLDVRLHPDGRTDAAVVSSRIDCSPAVRGETDVIRQIEDVALAECTTVQIRLQDAASGTTRWSLGRLVMAYSGGLGS